GTEWFAFTRLVQCVDELKGANGITDKIIVQLGHNTYEPKHCQWTRFLGFSDMRKHIDAADVVIAHAGAGTTLLCIERGANLIITPRRKDLSEHLDDHQIPFAKMIEDIQGARVIWDMGHMLSAIKNANADSKHTTKVQRPKAQSDLSRHVDSIVEQWCV
ncbi:MAG: glycosyltransferase, partial [Pseudomonadota bacterium]